MRLLASLLALLSLLALGLLLTLPSLFLGLLLRPLLVRLRPALDFLGGAAHLLAQVLLTLTGVLLGPLTLPTLLLAEQLLWGACGLFVWGLLGRGWCFALRLARFGLGLGRALLNRGRRLLGCGLRLACGLLLTCILLKSLGEFSQTFGGLPTLRF